MKLSLPYNENGKIEIKLTAGSKIARRELRVRESAPQVADGGGDAGAGGGTGSPGSGGSTTPFDEDNFPAGL